jgi:hypothetical protein
MRVVKNAVSCDDGQNTNLSAWLYTQVYVEYDVSFLPRAGPRLWSRESLDDID